MNIIYVLKYVGEWNKVVLDEIVEESLIKVVFWDEVKDCLYLFVFLLLGG